MKYVVCINENEISWKFFGELAKCREIPLVSVRMDTRGIRSHRKAQWIAIWAYILRCWRHIKLHYKYPKCILAVYLLATFYACFSFLHIVCICTSFNPDVIQWYYESHTWNVFLVFMSLPNTYIKIINAEHDLWSIYHFSSNNTFTVMRYALYIIYIRLHKRTIYWMARHPLFFHVKWTNCIDDGNNGGGTQ